MNFRQFLGVICAKNLRKSRISIPPKGLSRVRREKKLSALWRVSDAWCVRPREIKINCILTELALALVSYLVSCIESLLVVVNGIACL